MYSELAVKEYEAGLRDSLKQKHDSAIAHYGKAVKAAPGFFDVFLQLGFAHRELNNGSEAEKACRRAVEIRPNSGEALTALGGALLDRAGSAPAPNPVDEESVGILQRAVARTPWSSLALYFLGSALFKQNRFDEAETALRESLIQDKPNHEARLMLVNIFMKQRRYQEALDQLSEYLTAVPDSPQRPSVERMRTQIQDALKPPGAVNQPEPESSSPARTADCTHPN